MSAIVGLDLGYTYTKTSEEVIFPSRVSQVEPVCGGQGRKIELGGKTYYVGEGADTVELNKIDTDVTKVCMAYALAKSTQDSEVYVVTGIPIGQYAEQREQLRNMMLENRRLRMTVGGVDRTLNISDVKVYPQGAGALHAHRIEDDAIVVDIGGRTVDIAYFEYSYGRHKLLNATTIFEGMLVLFSSIISAVNSKFSLSLPAQEAEKILKRGLEVFGKQQDVSFVKPILVEHVEKIFRELMLNYPYQTKRIYLCGGGAILLSNIVGKRFPNSVLMNDGQFSNAVGFKKVGETTWGARRSS